MGSRGQKKRHSTPTLIKSDDDFVVCQRRGLLESHAMSEAHKKSYAKYRAFINHMCFDRESVEDRE